MRRGGPLRRGTPMTRTRMKVKPRRRSTVTLHDGLAGRSGGWCEMQIPAVCRGRAVHPCHRIGSKAGGRQRAAGVHHDRLSNVLHGCSCCHSWQTATAGNRTHAERTDVGWVLREGADTEARPVLYRGRLARLLNTGQVIEMRTDKPKLNGERTPE